VRHGNQDVDRRRDIAFSSLKTGEREEGTRAGDDFTSSPKAFNCMSGMTFDGFGERHERARAVHGTVSAGTGWSCGDQTDSSNNSMRVLRAKCTHHTSCSFQTKRHEHSLVAQTTIHLR
jgi:hypothetical protein